MATEVNNSSEWNEQQSFAELFFYYTRVCRNAQTAHRLFEWKKNIDSKILLTMGISTPKETDELDRLRKGMNNWARKCEKNRCKASLFADCLFYVESDVDKIANKHMPFLRIKKQPDIKGL